MCLFIHPFTIIYTFFDYITRYHWCSANLYISVIDQFILYIMVLKNTIVVYNQYFPKVSFILHRGELFHKRFQCFFYSGHSTGQRAQFVVLLFTQTNNQLLKLTTLLFSMDKQFFFYITFNWYEKELKSMHNEIPQLTPQLWQAIILPLFVLPNLRLYSTFRKHNSTASFYI